MSNAPLHVIIVGAGLTGLATGIALRRAGHHVDIYEKSNFAKEVGAAIACAPNATRALRSLGLDIKRARGVERLQTKYFTKDETDEDTTYVNTTDLKQNYGAPWFFCHRVDLHVELRRLATESEGEGKPCVLHLGCPVKVIDAEAGSITLLDGTVVTGDLLIGADGINSSVRRFVLGEEINPYPSGLATFRTVIPFEEVANNPSLSWVTTNPEALGLVWAEKRTLVVYPCRDGTLLNFSGNHPERRKDASEQLRINAPSTREEFLDSFGDFAERYKDLINLSKEVSIWPLLIWDELPTWTNGRTCIIGDAAHAMFPMLGQGGAQCFEDAVAIGILFPLGTPNDKETIEGRLKLFERVRKPRASEIQTMSNRFGKGQKLLKIEGKLEADLYAYDVIQVAKDALPSIGK
ncbi:FAD/NAD(P)-binding domain-containing protein [Sistotremastrum suecicum HHB10207 ss-3]|uniref:FAD/NAD(P)-binding domain-containing protein n=1 Tax=Sistotremastrum suecicum HHB10207 ss-3 TaxID=1314776 RepID=A0A166B856_9AGAM|nr:FAD/NAD(P)-binding domain-containing protein [Sistotremastrum suecicum HHB10207 ss-3]